MVIVIKRNANQGEIKAALKKIKAKAEKPKLMDFYGKMKGKFGDGLTYQKELRNEWD